MTLWSSAELVSVLVMLEIFIEWCNVTVESPVSYWSSVVALNNAN